MECSWENFLKTIFVIACLCFAIPIRIPRPKEPHEQNLLFLQYVKKYNKSYSNNSTELQNRFHNFKLSLKRIEELNANRTKGSAFYGITEFCDLTPQEFRRMHLKYSHNHHTHDKLAAMSRSKRAAISLPEKVDWRTKGVITGIKDQKRCGACWAFSTVECIESMFAIKNGSLPVLSVQQLVDCAGNGNYGCDGGDIKSLLEWMTAEKVKLQLEKDYPYKEKTDSCHYNPSKATISVTAYSCKNAIGAEDAVMDQVASIGPVAVAVNAADWQYYMGGTIQYHCSGAASDLNHAAQIVGFVRSASPPYYIVRNSWGTTFGLHGYLYLSTHSNTCGLANLVCSIDALG